MPPGQIMLPVAAQHTPGRPKVGRALSWLLLASAVLVMLLCFFAVLAFIGTETGPVILPLALLMAVTPVPIYGALALWLDRFEPEPIKYLAVAFLWGASIAAFAAFLLNSIGTVIVSESLGEDAAEIYGGSISAPVVEEAAKGAILFAFFLWRRHEFNGVIDGVVYAAMVGLGFAMTENVLYYGQGAVEQGVVGAVGTFIVRGIMSPFAHPVFTAATGIGLGIAAMSRSGAVRLLAPIAGLLVAMGLHSLWNTSALGGSTFLGVYFLIMIPLFAAIVAIVLVSRRREQKLVREVLTADRVSGLLGDHEIAMLSSTGARRRARKELKRIAGRRGARTMLAYQEAVTDYAFHLERERRGILKGEKAAQRRHELGSTVYELHRQLHQLGAGAQLAPLPQAQPVFVRRR